MKIGVSDLSFNQLSYAVTMLEMPNLVWGETIGIHHASNQVVVPEMKEPQCYSPYSTWEMCGPIIERFQMHIEHDYNDEWVAEYSHPYQVGKTRAYFRECGPTPLIAAMRCFVASKLGDEIDVPEELK